MVLVLALSLLVGLAVGLLGGGGSILTVPILVYVVGLEAKPAIATSLLVVGVTSAVATLSHARAGRVRFRTGVLFGAAGMVGAFLGGKLGSRLPAPLLLLAFAGVMVAASVAMLRGRRATVPEREGELPVALVVRDGFAVGLLTGTVGAGGGFLVVPALALLGGMPMAAAIGTSVLVIAMNSFAGLLGYLGTVQIAWGLAGTVTGAAVVGSFAGTALAGRLPQEKLRKAFGVFVLVMAAFILAKQWPTVLQFFNR
jgi:uncharacterized membrane protein YfcA